MMILSTTEFRANQRHYIAKACEGEEVFVKAPRVGTVKLVPVASAEASKESNAEFIARLRAAFEEIKLHRAGKVKLSTLDELIDEL